MTTRPKRHGSKHEERRRRLAYSARRAAARSPNSGTVPLVTSILSAYYSIRMIVSNDVRRVVVVSSLMLDAPLIVL